MNKHLQYLKFLILHKYYVAKECFQFGLYWRGIKHDWSKFLPSEWFPYVEYFYGKKIIENFYKNKSPNQLKTALENIEEEFNKAWLHHQHRNPHHWQHWVLREDNGRTFALEMGIKDAIEMYCDWVGAGLAITGKRDVAGWYEKNQDKMILHENTRKFVESLIYGRK